MTVIIVIFALNDKKLSPHMDHISEQINYSNHKTQSYDQMSKIIVNLGSNKFKNNDTSTCQLTRTQNLLLLSIVDTHEKDLSIVDKKIKHEKSTYIFSKARIGIIFLLNTCNA